ncbi:type II CRISPR RNA-guided endonuclease Cas9 [Chitinophaga nivalis]|uniref:CRISPR-associated endonuclease Cas9 n=1 Tax=Chitinophaga nivalis TaxID=2991709 RepID=A0ABT3IF19_9BACT|nr:type II CRISPR RNA-guided endonuclease Cas9 [Chitinophaga nivalis]MCW3467756.1 hypothetical protein [Chitinophaga nivalis]MCW3482552.1 hypothetical protein [Chitinophaga nivalis]
MTKILGIDAGTNSLGWALIDDVQQEIIAAGVRIFPEGVNRDNKGKEIPKNMHRRTKRQVRRQSARQKYRKYRLARYLMQYDMFPVVADIRKELQVSPLPAVLRLFFSIDPYECRSRAFNGEKLGLWELGRVLYHFTQRRGYKEAINQDNDEEGKLYEGSVKDNKIGINETQQLVMEYGTLGNGLYQTNPHEKRWRNRYTTRKMYTDEFEVIWERQQIFYPDLLTAAFKAQIGDATTGLLFMQRPLKSQSHLVGKCTLEKNKKRCRDSSIAFERRRTWEFINGIKLDGKPLSEQQRQLLVGLFFSKEKFNFDVIAKKLKIPINRFNYDDKKMVAGTLSISSLRKIFTPAIWDAKTLEEQEEILQIKYFAEDKEKTKAYLSRKFQLTEKQLMQFLQFKPSKGYSSLSYKATLQVLPFLEEGYLYHEAVWLGGIVNVFGKAAWELFPEEKKNYILSGAIDLYGTKDLDVPAATKQWLQTEFDISPKQSEKIYHHSIDFDKGDGSMPCLPEPENVRNPVVQQALFELRKVVNAIIEKYGKPDEIRIELSRELKSSIEDRNEIRIRQFENERENDAIKLLLDEWGNLPYTVGNIQKVKLYREIEKKFGQVLCPYRGDVITPRKLFNGEVDVEHIVPYTVSLDDSLANKTLCFREMNNRKGNRTPYTFFTQDMGPAHWEEVKARALQLLPYSKWRRFIEEKTPTLKEFEDKKLNDTRYISRVAKKYLEKVCKKVTVTQGEVTGKLRHYWGLDSLLNAPVTTEELPDGEYYIVINESKEVVKAVAWQSNKKANDNTIKELSKSGIVLQGNVRKHIFYPYKSRSDHRHHLVDALTIAFTKTSYLQQLSTMKGKGLLKEEFVKREMNFPEPWPGYYNQALQAVQQAMVSHQQRLRIVTSISKTIVVDNIKHQIKAKSIRGPLHGESIYGRRKDAAGNTAFHITKPLSQITKRAQVDKIVDPAVRNAVEAAIISTWQQTPLLFTALTDKQLVIPASNGWKINHYSKEKYEVPEGAFFEVEKDEVDKKIVAIKPKVFLTAYNGTQTPIRKVRIKENFSNAVPLKEGINQWVEPDNNFGVMVYQQSDGQLAEYVVTFWDAVEKRKQQVPVFDMPADGYKIIAILQINDLFILGLQADEIDWHNKQQLSKHLYRVQKISKGDYTFRKVTAATLSFDSELLRIGSFKAWKLQNPMKVKLDVLGNLQHRGMLQQ